MGMGNQSFLRPGLTANMAEYEAYQEKYQVKKNIYYYLYYNMQLSFIFDPICDIDIPRIPLTSPPNHPSFY